MARASAMKTPRSRARGRRPVITPAVAQIHQLVTRIFGRVEVVQVIRWRPQP